MARFTVSVSLQAAPSLVWDTVVDFPGRPQWSPRVKAVEVTPPGPLQEGSRVRLTVDKNAFTVRVKELRPPERLAMGIDGPGVRIRHEYVLRPGQDGATLLSLTGRYEGVIGGLLGLIAGRSMRRDLTDELADIRRAVESAAAAG